LLVVSRGSPDRSLVARRSSVFPPVNGTGDPGTFAYVNAII
jgi:hypothetical protein